MQRFIERIGWLLASSALGLACVGSQIVDGDLAPVSSPGTLRVEVVSQLSGAPLSDVVVRLEAQHLGSAPLTREQQITRERVGARALTDGAGRAHFAPDPGVDLWVRVLGRPGTSVDAVRSVAALQVGESKTIRFELPAPEMRRVRGTVVHVQSGAPVGAVRVAWLDDMPWIDGLVRPPLRMARTATSTGKDGRFELLVPADTELRLAFEAVGYQPMLAWLSSPDDALHGQPGSGSVPVPTSGPAAHATDAELVMALEPCEQRAIAVVDAQSRPLADVDVIVEAQWHRTVPIRLPGDPHAAEQDHIAIARTGADGVCWFPEPLVGGGFDVDAVSADGRWLAAQRYYGPDRETWPDPRIPLVWRLAELQPIEGRARFEDGSPAAGVVLGLGERQPKETVIGYQSRTFVALTRTAADGTFRFDAVRRPRPPLSWMVEPRPRPLDRLQIQRDALAPTRALVAFDGDGPPLPLDIELRAARYVTGRVNDSAGRPATKVRLGLRASDGSFDDSTTCDADGSFLLGPLAPGRYELRAGAESSAEPRSPCEVVIDTLGIVVTLDPDERQELVVE